jgi:hypothetical protein
MHLTTEPKYRFRPNTTCAWFTSFAQCRMMITVGCKTLTNDVTEVFGIKDKEKLMTGDDLIHYQGRTTTSGAPGHLPLAVMPNNVPQPNRVPLYVTMGFDKLLVSVALSMV